MGQEPCSGVFRGEVFSGRGEGSFYVSIYARSFRRKLGFTPYPGTLNVRLVEGIDEYNDCVRMLPKTVIEPPQIEGARLARVVVYRVYVNGYPAFAVRPEITVYRNDVVEVIAPEYLREKLRLKDGDTVYIGISRSSGE